jgi:hypothetical protein
MKGLVIFLGEKLKDYAWFWLTKGAKNLCRMNNGVLRNAVLRDEFGCKINFKRISHASLF